MAWERALLFPREHFQQTKMTSLDDSPPLAPGTRGVFALWGAPERERERCTTGLHNIGWFLCRSSEREKWDDCFLPYHKPKEKL